MYNTPHTPHTPQHQSVFPQQIRYDIYMKMI